MRNNALIECKAEYNDSDDYLALATNEDVDMRTLENEKLRFVATNLEKIFDTKVIRFKITMGSRMGPRYTNLPLNKLKRPNTDNKQRLSTY